MTPEQQALLDRSQDAAAALVVVLDVPYENTVEWWDNVCLASKEADNAVEQMSPDKFGMDFMDYINNDGGPIGTLSREQRTAIVRGD